MCQLYFFIISTLISKTKDRLEKIKQITEDKLKENNYSFYKSMYFKISIEILNEFCTFMKKIISWFFNLLQNWQSGVFWLAENENDIYSTTKLKFSMQI